MKTTKRIIMSVAGLLLSAFTVVSAQVWEAPAVPAEDLSTVKSVTVGYLLNVEADAFVVNGMTSNVQACATRLTNGDTRESTPHRCTAMVASDGTVRIRLSSNSSYYISCATGTPDQMWVNRTTNAKYTFTETAEGSHVYVLHNTTIDADLDVAWTYGGPLTLKDGQGKTAWAFIKETSVTNGDYAIYKAKRQLYDIYKVLADGGKTSHYNEALTEAYEVYSAADVTTAKLTEAARKLLKTVYADITTPMDVSFLLVNADMVGSGSTDGWDKGSPAFSWAEFETYHSVCSLIQAVDLPIGTYDVGFHSLYRQDGSDAAPTFTVTASNTVKTTVPNLSEIDFGVTNATENNWKKGPTYFQPDGMKSCGQALAHGDAVAWCRDVVSDGSGEVTLEVAMNSGSQWLNWQGFTIIYKGTSADALREQLKAKIAEAQELYGDGTGKEADVLLWAIDEAQKVYDNASSTNQSITSWIESIVAAIDTYRKANASEANPLDWTDLLTNPSFEDGTDGWTVDGMGTQGNSVFSIKAGSTYMERWTGKGNKVGDGSVVQTLKDLPIGRYQLKVAAQNIQEDASSRAQKGAWIVANGDSLLVTTRKQYTLTFTNIENDVEIGFVAKGATGNWIACDNFRLYYIGGTDEDYRTKLSEYIEKANKLKEQWLQMRDVAPEELTDAIKHAENALVIGMLYSKMATALRLATEESQKSYNAYKALDEALTEAESLANSNKDNPGYDKFMEFIYHIEDDVWSNTEATNEELYAAIDQLDDAKTLFLMQSPTGAIPTITTDKRYARGATMAFGRFTYKLNGAKMKLSGFCYSTEHNPTIFDEKSTRTLTNNGLIYVMENMKPATVYYARPYILTEGYQVAYGDELKIITIPKGTMTYWYNNGGSPEENDRINYALQNGTKIWNDLMNIQGVNLSVSYGSGTPTADCSYGGSMRVGPHSAYQRTGTIMHEAAHGVGVGTIGGWWAMLVDGVWTGVRANEVLQFWDNDNSAKMHGDSQHMWPYGINGAQEDSGTDLLYYGNALIIEGLHEDGVQPTGNCFTSPAYTFDYVDDQWYYIQNESADFGFQKAYLQATASGLKWTEVATESLGTDESFAWTITFDPKTQFYSFRNVGTGAYITYNGSKFTTVKRETPTASEKLQLMPSRNQTTWKNGSKSYKLRGYWMLKANGGSATAMTGAANSAVSGTSFDNNQNDTKQRWLILGEENGIASEIKNLTPTLSQGEGAVYNLNGQKMAAPQKGLNIIGGKKVLIK